MFTGVKFEQAIEYWQKGREVIVLDRNSQNENGGYDNFPFEELFRNVELLADVPAVENPDFKEAVAEMMQGDSSKEENDAPPTRPEAEETVKELPAGKSKKEIIAELADQGLSAPEIAKQTGIKYNTVYFHLNPDKCKPKKEQKGSPAKVVTPGWNADRHACETCRYRTGKGGARANGAKCDYIELVGHRRGCAAEDCDKYEK